MGVLAAGVDWFPQGYAHEFYVIKGVLSLIATVLLVTHMSMTWHRVETPGRRWRYYALLAFALLLTSSTIEQVNDDAIVSYRNLGALVAAGLLLIAMVVSIREDLQAKP